MNEENSDNLIREHWLRYKDTEYFVSDEGRICRRYKNGKARMLSPYRIKPSRNNLFVKIGNRQITVARIVWETFYGDVPEGYVVHHKNGAATMNDLNNLELITISENCSIARRTRGGRIIYDKDRKCYYRDCIDASRKLFISRETVRSYCNHKVKNPLYHLEWSQRKKI